MEKLDRRKIRRRIAVIVLLLLGASGCDLPDSRTAADHVAKARALRERGDVQGAIIELKNALQKNPDHAQARVLLGQAYLEKNDGAAAEKELRRAIELRAAKAELLLPLAEALRFQGKHQVLLAEIVPDAALPPRQQAILTAWRGDAWLALRKPEPAKREYAEALATDPESPPAKLGLARLAVRGQRFEDAQRLISEALAVDSKDPRLWQFQASLWERANQLEKAETAYTQAMALHRINLKDRAGRALVRIAARKYREAREDINALKQAAPNYYLAHYADGLLALREHHYPEAQAAFEAAERLNGRFPLTQYQLGLVHLNQNHPVQADQHLSHFLQSAPKSLGGIELLALARFRQREFASVKSLLAPVLDARPDDGLALRLLGETEIALGNLQQGIDHLHTLVERDPGSTNARRGLGLSLLASGATRQGLAELQAAADLDPSALQPKIVLALVQLRAKAFDQASDTIARIRTHWPDSEAADTLLGLSSLARNDGAAARQSFERALRKKPGDPAISHRLARLAVNERRFDEARRLYEDVLKVHRGDMATEIRLARVDALEGRFERMAARMEAIIKDHPQAWRPRLILAEYLLSRGQPDRVPAVLAPLQASYPRQPDLLALLVQAQLDTGQASLALNTAQSLVEAAPNSAKAHYLLALAQADRQNSGRMRQALERALALDAGFVPARQALVRVLALEKNYPQAAAVLAKLLREYPDDAEVLSLQGWLALVQGQAAEAVRAYRKALEKAPGTRSAAKLAQAQWQAGDKTGAIASLETWTRTHPEDSFSRYLLAGLYRETGRTEEARQCLEDVLRLNPRNIPALNDLAWLLRRSDPERALVLAERATEAMPEAPLLLDTQAALLLDRGRHAQARDVLRRAVALDPGNPSLNYRLAVALSSTGQTEDALRIVRALLADDRPFPEREAAQAWLRKRVPPPGG